MVEVIEFVMHRGSSYGYRLVMKKCIYLMAPTYQRLYDEDTTDRVDMLTSLGIPIDNVNISHDCQPDALKDLYPFLLL